MTVRVADIAFVRFEAPDLDVMESFLTDVRAPTLGP